MRVKFDDDDDYMENKEGDLSGWKGKYHSLVSVYTLT